jgi:drug/metabolite transporter (DMT)-like permease
MLAIALAVTGAQAPKFTAESVAAIVVLGVIGTGFAYVLNYQIITSEGATIASTVTYLLPVVAIVLGVLVLGDTATAMILAGIRSASSARSWPSSTTSGPRCAATSAWKSSPSHGSPPPAPLRLRR